MSTVVTKWRPLLQPFFDVIYKMAAVMLPDVTSPAEIVTSPDEI